MQIEYRKFINGRIAAKFQTTVEQAEVIDQTLAGASHVSTVHGNCRPVMVWGDINEEVYAERVREHGAKPITELLFPSAKAASLHFGYPTWAVRQALNQAKERGEQIAVLGGVPIRWADEVPGID